MTSQSYSKYIKQGAIWGFILVELIFFSVAGHFLSLSDTAFMDFDNRPRQRQLVIQLSGKV